MFRASVLRLGAQEHVLLLTMHHIVSDGWSMGVLMRELGALYAGVSQRARLRRCRSLRCSTRTMRSGSGGWLQGEVLERQLAYWREQLAGVPSCWSCRRTGRGRRCTSFRGAAGAVRAVARSCRGGSRSWPQRRARRCSWCCWRPSRCCSAAGAGSRTSWWARRSPAARTAS